MDSPIYHLEGVVKAKTEDMEDFVGPLDLILHLLSKNKMEIKDIQISLILDQYLAWMAARKEMDLEVASEFVTMASQLVYIKTRMLLSIHDEEALSEMEQLISSLEEHQRNENYLKIKEITPLLDRRYSYWRDFITKVPETIQPDRTYRYVHDREDLKKAILSVLSRADHQLPPPVAAFQGIVGREPYPVSEKAGDRGHPVPRPVPGQPQPLRGGGHLPGGAGAVQGPPPAAGRDGGGLYHHLHPGGAGGPFRGHSGFL